MYSFDDYFPSIGKQDRTVREPVSATTTLHVNPCILKRSDDWCDTAIYRPIAPVILTIKFDQTVDDERQSLRPAFPGSHQPGPTRSLSVADKLFRVIVNWFDYKGCLVIGNQLCFHARRDLDIGAGNLSRLGYLSAQNFRR